MTKDGEIPEKVTAGTREGASACAAAPALALGRGVRVRSSSRCAVVRSGRRACGRALARARGDLLGDLPILRHAS